jgi:hypothetical protein
MLCKRAKVKNGCYLQLKRFSLKGKENRYNKHVFNAVFNFACLGHFGVLTFVV